MNFNSLDTELKKQLHEELTLYSNSIGGKNFFLQAIDDIKKEKVHPLLNKSSAYHFSRGKITWNKQIYKDTLSLLFTTLKGIEKDENYFDTSKLKVQKSITNMMKALKPISIQIRPKDEKDGEGFDFSIIDSSNTDDIKVSLIFKIVFFYNINLAKDILNYKV